MTIKQILFLVIVFLFVNDSKAQLSATSSKQNATCGQANGWAKVTPSGGSSYTYVWSTSETTDSIGGLSFGSYTVTITGLVGGVSNSLIDTFQINSLNIDLSGVIIKDAVCGNNDGEITGIKGLGGTTPYTYNWDSAGVPFSNSATLQNVYAGTYRLKIVDASSSCAFDTSFVILLAGLPTLKITPNPNICAGDSVALIVSGTSSGTFTWSGGDLVNPFIGDTLIRYPSVTNTYNLIWTDGYCTIKLTPTINVGKADINFTYALNDTICLGSTTSISVTSSGSGGTFTWTGGDLVAPKSGNSITVSPAFANSFRYAVSWVNGTCTSTDTSTLLVTQVNAVLVNSTPPSCGKNNGSINCAVNGISPFNFTFLKNGTVVQSGSSSQIANQGPGTYTFIVTGTVTGCSDTIKNIVLVDNSSSPYIDAFTATSIKCFGDADATATISLKGGTGNYTYKWSQDANNTSNTASGLTSGISYTVSFSDGGCSSLDTTFTINGPSAALSLVLTKSDDNCLQGVGTAKATVSGGTTAYTYNWANGQQGIGIDSLSSLTAGTRIDLTVTDANGCSVAASDSIGNTGSPSAVIQNSDSVCTGSSNGKLTVLPTSNDGPFSFIWSNGDTTATATNLSENNYTVTVTNSKKCGVVVTGSVATFSGGFVDLGADKTIALGETVELNASTGVNPKSVVWSPYVPNSGASLLVYAKPTDTTLYKVKITYGRNCAIEDSVVVNVIKEDAKLVMPNVFSPNGDGVNDYFYVTTHKLIRDFHIWIYNRWGDKVFESTDVDFKWDGTNIFMSNQEMNTAVMGYVIEYHTTISNQKIISEGNVTLVK